MKSWEYSAWIEEHRPNWPAWRKLRLLAYLLERRERSQQLTNEDRSGKV